MIFPELLHWSLCESLMSVLSDCLLSACTKTSTGSLVRSPLPSVFARAASSTSVKSWATTLCRCLLGWWSWGGLGAHVTPTNMCWKGIFWKSPWPAHVLCPDMLNDQRSELYFVLFINQVNQNKIILLQSCSEVYLFLCEFVSLSQFYVCGKCHFFNLSSIYTCKSNDTPTSLTCTLFKMLHMYLLEINVPLPLWACLW